MSGSPARPLQEAVYARLSGDTTLVTTLGCDVFDHVVDAESFPYVAIGDITEVRNSTMGRTGRDFTMTLQIVSQFNGYDQVNDIHNRVDQLLDRWAPTVTGWNATQMQHEFFETFRDPDGLTRHGRSRYGIHIHA